jgi:SAM-dependent methyltransferase
MSEEHLERGEVALMRALPPGTILQLMYLQERLRSLAVGEFIEVGPGAGEITRLLLASGWKGQAFDYDGETVERLRGRFSRESDGGRLRIFNEDYTSSPHSAPADLVISSMVMEHMGELQLSSFMAKAAEDLRPGGRMIGLVPASPRHWGIEDEIAGHLRRYTRLSLNELASSKGWKLTHIAGLTYPVSNLLLPISNYLVRRKERSKLGQSAEERTKQSGRRDVLFKTRFPSPLRFLLNERSLAPLHVMQKMCAESDRALVLYFEASPRDGTRERNGDGK